MLNTLLVFRKKCKYTTCFPVSSSLVSPSLFRVPSSEGLRRQGRKGQSNRFKCSIFCCFHFLVDFTIIKLLTIFKFELDVHSALPSFLPRRRRRVTLIKFLSGGLEKNYLVLLRTMTLEEYSMIPSAEAQSFPLPFYARKARDQS